MIFGHLSQIAIFIAMCATAVFSFLFGLLLSRASDKAEAERLRTEILSILDGGHTAAYDLAADIRAALATTEPTDAD